MTVVLNVVDSISTHTLCAIVCAVELLRVAAYRATVDTSFAHLNPEHLEHGREYPGVIFTPLPSPPRYLTLTMQQIFIPIDTARDRF